LKKETDMPEKAKTKKTEKKEDKGFFITRTARKAVDGCRDTLNDYSNKYVRPVVDSAGKISERARTDAGKAMDRVSERAGKIITGIPGVKSVEKKIDAGLEAVTGYLNLPTKTDIENLTRALENLSSKMDILTEKQSA
jgi:polyhydroxyalkanoate synthesis regulator phasin